MDKMRVTATQLQNNFGAMADKALTEPVIVTRNGRDRVVMISVEEYERLKRRDRQVYSAADMPQDIIDAVARSEMDTRHTVLDDELED